MAALHVLLATGTRVVLPPPFLCCGFPAHVNARTEQHGRTVLQDTILFAQIREMFSHLAFDACVITCGTCREGLQHMEAGSVFGGRIVDVAAYAAERGLSFPGGSAPPAPTGEAGSGPHPGSRVMVRQVLSFDGGPGAGGADEVLYHPPCHDSLDGRAAEVLATLGGFGKPLTVPHCCSEAGTLALSRPDITDAMLHRKREALAEARLESAASVVLTNCPSCLQGLGRNRPLGFEPKHLAVALAEKVSGPRWLEAFRKQGAAAQRIRF
jgi:Fe-S oxidoreductase